MIATNMMFVFPTFSILLLLLVVVVEFLSNFTSVTEASLLFSSLSVLAFSGTSSSFGKVNSVSNNGSQTRTNDIMIQQMISFFADTMINSTTNRFYYEYNVMDESRRHQHVPIRELGCTWDATKAVMFLQQQQQQSAEKDVKKRMQVLCQVIDTTLKEYKSYLMINDGGSSYTLNSQTLKEPSTLAHSAMLILVATNVLRFRTTSTTASMNGPSSGNSDVDLVEMIGGLVEGILISQHSTTGAFRTHFDEASFNNQQIDFVPGQAMLAMMDAYSFLHPNTQHSILTCMKQATKFYINYYHTEHPKPNYCIWQIQAFCKYLEILLSQRNDDDQQQHQVLLIDNVSQYVMQMCQDIIQSKAWKYDLRMGTRSYPNLNVVEIACGLDSLADGIRACRFIGDSSSSALLPVLERNAFNAIEFLKWSQDRSSNGGLGFGGLTATNQRLDVTGHALSALLKLNDLGMV